VGILLALGVLVELGFESLLAAAATTVKNHPKLDTDGSGTKKTCKEQYSAKWADVMALKKEWADSMVKVLAEGAKYKKSSDKIKLVDYYEAVKAYLYDKNCATPSNDSAFKTNMD
jgi:hypothetical protein